MSEPHEILTWERFPAAIDDLASQVHKGNFEADIILGIARGGLIPAAALAYALERKNVFSVNVEFYTGVDKRMEFPVMLPPLLNAVDIHGARILIVDDVADTGRTLDLVKTFCAEHVREARVAVLYEKPRSIVKCEYVWERTDRWIDFPWSTRSNALPDADHGQLAKALDGDPSGEG